MLRSVLAVLGGFITMAILVMISTAVAAQKLIPGGLRAMATPGTPVPRAYLTANLAASALAAFLGGFVTARIAATMPLRHGLYLAAFMCAMGMLSARMEAGRQPRWYQVIMCTVMPAIAVLGAWLGGQTAGEY